MAKVNLPGVAEKGGCLYYRRTWREGGKRRELYLRLPALTDPGFPEAYEKARNGPVAAREGPEAGSLEALVIEFRAAIPGMRARKTGEPLSPATVDNYRRYCGLIVEEAGRAPVAEIQPADVVELVDRLAETPGKAYLFLSVLRTVLGWGRLRGWCTHNAAERVPPPSLTEHQPWPAIVLEAALRVAGPMTRLAIVSGLCSGWRIGDVIRIQHGWHDRELIQNHRAGKTGVASAMPMHPLWLEEIDRIPKRAVTLLYDRSGRPFRDPKPIQSVIRRLMQHRDVRAAIEQAAALGECKPDDTFVFHGLRKNACCYLTEMALSDTAVGALLGMSPEMVRHYGKKKRILMIARDASTQVTGGKVVGLRWETRSEPSKISG